MREALLLKPLVPDVQLKPVALSTQSLTAVTLWKSLYLRALPSPIAFHFQVNLSPSSDFDQVPPILKNMWWPLKLFEQESPNTLDTLSPEYGPN